MRYKFWGAFILAFLVSATGYSQASNPMKIDEFDSINCEEYLARMDAAMIQAKSNPTSQVFVYIYEGNVNRSKFQMDGTYSVKSVPPEYGLANARIRSMKKFLAIRKISLDQFRFVNAGFHKDFTVEMWLVPKGGTEPKSTPTLTKMKYRKGKPLGFCLSCEC